MSTDLERRLRETLERKQAEITGPMPGNDVLRRARRRATRNVALGSSLSVAVIAGLVITIASIASRRPATNETTLPTPGPVPGERSLAIAHGTEGGYPWTLRVTQGDGYGYGLAFGFDDMGGGGSGIEPFRGSQTFHGYGGSSTLSYPNGDPSQPPLPYDISGQVRSGVTRVTLELVDGPTIEGQVFPLPDDLVGPSSVFVLFVPPETLLLSGELVGYDASGAEVGRAPLDLGSVWIAPKVREEISPEGLAVVEQLQLAGAIVDRYFAAHQSYSGLTPDTAAEISPAVAFNTSDAAVPGEVSLRVSGHGELVLASTTPSGDVYSVCFQEGSASVFGRNDTSDPYGCTNGWLDPGAPPPPRSDSGAVASGADEHGNLWTMSLVDTGQDTELMFEMGPVGISKPLEPLGDEAVGSTAAAEPNATVNDLPAEPTQPTGVIGIASADVDRVELRVDGGDTISGTLYALPDNPTGATQAFVILVPTQEAFSGTVVGADTHGNETGSASVTADPTLFD